MRECNLDTKPSRGQNKKDRVELVYVMVVLFVVQILAVVTGFVRCPPRCRLPPTPASGPHGDSGEISHRPPDARAVSSPHPPSHPTQVSLPPHAAYMSAMMSMPHRSSMLDQHAGMFDRSRQVSEGTLHRRTLNVLCACKCIIVGLSERI